MKEKILLFIPVYNCEKQIGRTLAKLDPKTASHFAEILIIDNRSTDQTLKVSAELIKKIKTPKVALLQNQKNYSLGGTHKVAFNYALDHGYDYVAILHGDDQGDVRDLISYLEKGTHRTVDCLLGARFMPGATLVNYSRFRTFGNHVFDFLFSLVCGQKLYDLGAGLNLYNTRFLKNRFYLSFPNALTFNYYLILYAVFTKAKIHFFPIVWKEEDQISNVKLFKQGKKLAGLFFHFLFSPKTLLEKPHEKETSYTFDCIEKNDA
ncbi:MAG: glycosyltransferase family 2 protein [Chlamydiae bacterium]|nr:glycosyltransferase family 2 protein [Chlamydiota bacterium]